MGESLEIKIQNRVLTLCAPGGVYDASTESLFVADCHFGKDATFRSHSIPVPTGSNLSTIEKINRMLSRLVVSRLVILGDMFHDRSALTRETIQDLDTFFEIHHKLDFFLVPGNHDANIHKLPEYWNVSLIQAGNHLDDLILSHYPLRLDRTDHVSQSSHGDGLDLSDKIILCGHLHPAIRIGSRGEQLKLPCFMHRDQNLILPAIGDFTGTQIIQPKRTDQVWIIAENELLPWDHHCKTA